MGRCPLDPPGHHGERSKPPTTASDKLFFWLFQSQPDRILQLLEDLPADAGGYRFVAPVFKAIEHRPDGVFMAPVERNDMPALTLEPPDR
jgi:hypothetical protein